MPNERRFSAVLSTRPRLDDALDEVCTRGREQLGDTPDFAVLFVSAAYAEAGDRLAADVCERLGTTNLLGCTGESIVGLGREVEDAPALSLWLAKWPGVTATLMHLEFQQTHEGPTIVGWPDGMPEPWPANSVLLLLGDPYSFPADYLLERLNEDQPGTPVVGGMASGGAGPGENRLLIGPRAIDHGAAAVLLHGDVRLRTVVSQGCRPIGRPFVVTKAEQNVLFELGGRRAMLQLKDVFEALPNQEKSLVQRGLHVGRVVNEYADRFEQGDFLIRNVIAIDRDSGGLVIGDFVRPGQTVQFHIRDQVSADDEMRQLFAALRDSSSAAGALLFTCNGRGTRLFDVPHHDAGVIQQMLGDIPVAGFFAQGEMGPVGGRNFLHGFTASAVVFET